LPSKAKKAICLFLRVFARRAKGALNETDLKSVEKDTSSLVIYGESFLAIFFIFCCFSCLEKKAATLATESRNRLSIETVAERFLFFPVK
jgi:hypothetical protein